MSCSLQINGVSPATVRHKALESDEGCCSLSLSLSLTHTHTHTHTHAHTHRSSMIFYDEDTKMFFTAVKGESTIAFHELTDKPPHLSPGEGTSFSGYTLPLTGE